MPAGYSGTPLACTLGIKPGHRVGPIGAPAGCESTLEGLPDGVRLSRRASAVDETRSGLRFVYRLADRPPGRR